MPDPQRDRVRAFRLTRHHLGRRASGQDLAKILGDIGGVQAQVMGAASLALWARVAGLTAVAVDDALLSQRTLVRTWAMRGTLHLLPAAELLIYLAGLRAAWRGRERWVARLGVDEKLADHAVIAIESALARGPLSRRDLSVAIRGALGRKVVGAVDQTLARTVEDGCARVMLEYASARGVVCLGRPRGQEITFVRVDQWVREPRPAPVQRKAEERLLRGYLSAFGPATPADFAHWSGIPASDAVSIMNRLRKETLEVQLNGRSGVLLRRDVPVLERAKPVRMVRLLPNFDTYLLGHEDKGLSLDPAHYKDVYRKAGWLAATVLVDGRVVGTWRREDKGRPLIIQLRPFQKLSRSTMAAIEGEAKDLARFLNMPSAEVRPN